jgi:hypothetical protein
VFSIRYVTKATVKTYELSQTFDAPLDFVFKWCTDFREDDAKMVGSTAKRTFLERTDKRIVWAVSYKESNKQKEGIRAVWLHPPDSWHLDTCGDTREVGDYKLTSKGKSRTRLDMVFHVTYEKGEEATGRREWEKEVKGEWKLYAKYLEKDYKSSLQQTK